MAAKAAGLDFAKLTLAILAGIEVAA